MVVLLLVTDTLPQKLQEATLRQMVTYFFTDFGVEETLGAVREEKEKLKTTAAVKITAKRIFLVIRLSFMLRDKVTCLLVETKKL